MKKVLVRVLYAYEIPNFNMQITKSGNYLLKVFDYDKGHLILTRRFCVTENIVNINVTELVFHELIS